MWEKDWGKGKIIFCHGNTNSRGTCILIKPNVNIDITKEIKDSTDRLIILKAIIDNVNHALVNLYAPNAPGKAIDFFASFLSSFIHAHEKGNFCL